MGPAASPLAPSSPAPLLLSSPFETDAAPEGQRRGVLLETDQTAEQTRERERKTRYRQKKREKKRREVCRKRATMGCVGNQMECSGGAQSVEGCENALRVLRVTVTKAAMVDPLPKRSLPFARKHPQASLGGASVPERGYKDTRGC